MIRYYLTKLSEGTFVFQIEKQEDRLTNYIVSRPGKYYQARNGWKVAIDAEPAIDIDAKVVYLRGSESDQDERVSRHWGLGGKECKNIIKAINDAISEVVEAAKNWTVPTQVKFIPVIEVRTKYDPYGPFCNFPGIVIIK